MDIGGKRAPGKQRHLRKEDIRKTKTLLKIGFRGKGDMGKKRRSGNRGHRGREDIGKNMTLGKKKNTRDKNLTKKKRILGKRGH